MSRQAENSFLKENNKKPYIEAKEKFHLNISKEKSQLKPHYQSVTVHTSESAVSNVIREI